MIRRTVWLLLVCLLLPGHAWSQTRRNAPSFDPRDPLARALKKHDIYIDKTMRATVNPRILATASAVGPALRPLKIAVVDYLPESGRHYGSRDSYTQALHDYLHLNHGTLIVITSHGISVATDSLLPAQIAKIVRAQTNAIQSRPEKGILRMVLQLDMAADGRHLTAVAVPGNLPDQRTGGGMADFWWLLPASAGIGGLVWAGRHSVRKRS